ncbi:MAG TPA: DUF2244 domain-containing protein [Usitatibacter sp.]|nr:DUF2244 domain-containing protein [Usitatibacter sp.]
MAPSADSPPFVHFSVPNRSLGVAERRWVLVAIAATTFAVATAAAVLGAWPVMPFAGLEVVLVAFAFHLVRLHDGDFERLEIGEFEVRVEAREAACVTRFVAHRPWARVVLRQRGERCTLRLAYAGRTVALGRLLSDEGRRRLAGELRGRISVTAN